MSSITPKQIKKECLICYEGQTQFYSFRCNRHSACTTCVQKILNSDTFQCPYCRKKSYIAFFSKEQSAKNQNAR